MHSLQTMLENLELRNLVAAVVVSSAYLVSRVVFFLPQRRLAVALAILRGNWWVLRHFPRIVAKRRRVQRSRRLRDNFFVPYGLMVSFLEGFREFARLRRLERELNRIGGWSQQFEPSSSRQAVDTPKQATVSAVADRSEIGR
jgi:hypothetical protein